MEEQFMSAEKTIAIRRNPGDRIIKKDEMFFAVVDHRIYGGWRSRAEAVGGMRVEQGRAVERAKKESQS